MSQTPFAVIIPAYNEAANIPRMLAALDRNRTTVGEFEVLVVDNLSSDDSVILARNKGCRVLENDSGRRLTIAALRNRGAQAGHGEVLVFLDADMLVPEDWLAQAKARFDAGFQGVLGFVDMVPAAADWVARVWGNRDHLKVREERSVDFIPGRNLFVSRKVFEAVGGFDESLTTNEDKDFTYRVVAAGYPVLQLPEPPVIHLGYEKGLGEFMRKEFWRQSTTLSFARKHGWAWRTLRNPLLSLAHVATLGGFLFAALGGAGGLAALLLAAWLLPSAAIAWRSRGADVPWAYRWQLFLLTLLRWTVSGTSLLNQVARAAIARFRKGQI